MLWLISRAETGLQVLSESPVPPGICSSRGVGKSSVGSSQKGSFVFFMIECQECTAFSIYSDMIHRGQDRSLVFSGSDSFESGGQLKEKKQNCVFPGNLRHCCYVQLFLSRLYLEASRGRFVPIRSEVVFESLQAYLPGGLLLFLEPRPNEYVGKNFTDFRYECSP